MRFAWRCALAAALALVAAVPAGAQEPPRGLHVDPGSPGGKEYAIPLEQARSDAGGASRGGPGGSTLFGKGVRPAPRAESSRSGERATSAASGAVSSARRAPSRRTRSDSPRDHSAAAGGGDSAGSPRSSASSAPPVPRNPTAAGGGGDSFLAVAGLVAAMAIFGGGAGLVLRRRLGPAG